MKIRQTRTGDSGSEETYSDFTRAVTVSYKPEYRHLGINEEYLREIARVSGGKFNPTVEDLLRVDDKDSVAVRKKIWPWLVGAALILFLLDVTLRRLDLAGYRLFERGPERYG